VVSINCGKIPVWSACKTPPALETIFARSLRCASRLVFGSEGTEGGEGFVSIDGLFEFCKPGIAWPGLHRQPEPLEIKALSQYYTTWSCICQQKAVSVDKKHKKDLKTLMIVAY
jgi:hypothetical protein